MHLDVRPMDESEDRTSRAASFLAFPPSVVPLWDCNVYIGRESGRRGLASHVLGADGLIAEMDRVGIAGGMTYHVLAREYAPAVGNAALLDELGDLAEQSRLLPVWAVMPDHTEELPSPSEQVRRMLCAGVRMARMFPSSAMSGQRFSLAEWCSGELLDALEAARMPLEIDFTLFRRGEPPWDDVYSICKHHPQLPLILIDVQGRNNRTLYALLKRFESLYVQTAGLNVHSGLEDVVRRFGAGRLLFGSGFPILTFGGARLQLERALLPDTDKAAIGSGNLRRLLDGVATPKDSH